MATCPAPEPRRSTRSAGCPGFSPEVAAGPQPEHPPLDQLVEHRPGRPAAEQVQVVRGQMMLGRRAGKVRAQDERIGRIDHCRLHRPVEHRLGMPDQVGVQRVLAGHEDHQGPPAGRTAAARPPGLLPQCGQRAGIPGDDGRVQTGDVDAELQRVGAGQAEQFAGVQRAFELAPVLRQVPAAVGGDPGRQLGSDPAQPPAGGEGDLLRALPGPDEGQGAGPARDQVGQQPGRLRLRRGSTRRRCRGGDARGPGRRIILVGAGRRLPQHEIGGGPGRSVLGDRPDRAADQPAGRRGGLGRGRRRQHEHRVRSVQPGHPHQPAQYQRDVRAEHSPVGVAFVDHHERQPPPQPGPVRMMGEQAQVQHVGVGQQPVGVAPAPSPARRRGCRRRRPPVAAPVPTGRTASRVDRPPAPWSGPGRARSSAGRSRSRSAPEVDSPATCRTPCRWPSRRRHPDGPARPRPPDASRAARCPRPAGHSEPPVTSTRASRPPIPPPWAVAAHAAHRV